MLYHFLAVFLMHYVFYSVLHAEATYYTTAYSYFLEAFQNLGTQDDGKGALGALKYMLLYNVVLNLVNRLCRCCCRHSGGTLIGFYIITDNDVIV